MEWLTKLLTKAEVDEPVSSPLEVPDAYRVIAKKLGFTVHEEEVAGTLDGFDVAVAVDSVDSEDTQTYQTQIEVKGSIPRNLSIAGSKGPGRSDDLLGITTGDETFDAAVIVGGDELETVAMLGETARDLLQEAISKGLWVMSGRLVVERATLIRDADSLEDEVRTAVQLAGLVRSDPDTVISRLAQNIRGDSHPGVRHRNLKLLLSRFPESQEAQDAASAALGRSNSDARLLAAAFLKT